MIRSKSSGGDRSSSDCHCKLPSHWLSHPRAINNPCQNSTGLGIRNFSTARGSEGCCYETAGDSPLSSNISGWLFKNLRIGLDQWRLRPYNALQLEPPMNWPIQESSLSTHPYFPMESSSKLDESVEARKREIHRCAISDDLTDPRNASQASTFVPSQTQCVYTSSCGNTKSNEISTQQNFYHNQLEKFQNGCHHEVNPIITCGQCPESEIEWLDLHKICSSFIRTYVHTENSQKPLNRILLTPECLVDQPEDSSQYPNETDSEERFKDHHQQSPQAFVSELDKLGTTDTLEYILNNSSSSFVQESCQIPFLAKGNTEKQNLKHNHDVSCPILNGLSMQTDRKSVYHHHHHLSESSQELSTQEHLAPMKITWFNLTEKNDLSGPDMTTSISEPHLMGSESLPQYLPGVHLSQQTRKVMKCHDIQSTNIECFENYTDFDEIFNADLSKIEDENLDEEQNGDSEFSHSERSDENDLVGNLYETQKQEENEEDGQLENILQAEQYNLEFNKQNDDSNKIVNVSLETNNETTSFSQPPSSQCFAQNLDASMMNHDSFHLPPHNETYYDPRNFSFSENEPTNINITETSTNEPIPSNTETRPAVCAFLESMKVTMHHSLGIDHSFKLQDDVFEYRFVALPRDHPFLQFEWDEASSNYCMSEAQWRLLGIRQTRGWEHIGYSPYEGRIILFRRPLDRDSITGKPTAGSTKKVEQRVKVIEANLQGASQYEDFTFNDSEWPITKHLPIFGSTPSLCFTDPQLDLNDNTWSGPVLNQFLYHNKICSQFKCVLSKSPSMNSVDQHVVLASFDLNNQSYDHLKPLLTNELALSYPEKTSLDIYSMLPDLGSNDSPKHDSHETKLGQEILHEISMLYAAIRLPLYAC